MIRSLLVALVMTVLACSSACSDDQCIRLCQSRRELLYNNFGVTLDCADPKWTVDCDRCYAVFKTDYRVDITPGICEFMNTIAFFSLCTSVACNLIVAGTVERLPVRSRPAPASSPAVRAYSHVIAERILTVINAQRADSQVTPLLQDPVLTRAAIDHSEELAARGTDAMSSELWCDPRCRLGFGEAVPRVIQYGVKIVKHSDDTLKTAAHRLATVLVADRRFLEPRFDITAMGVVRARQALVVTFYLAAQ